MVRLWLYRLAIKPGNNLLPRLQRLHITIGEVTPDELILLLHSRRSAPVNWTHPEQDIFEFDLQPYDSASAHWQHHTRLLEFSAKYEYDGRREMEWDWTSYSDSLDAMMKEAKKVEGFDYFFDSWCRIVF